MEGDLKEIYNDINCKPRCHEMILLGVGMWIRYHALSWQPARLPSVRELKQVLEVADNTLPNMTQTLIPSVNSLVKYESPVLVTKHTEKKPSATVRTRSLESHELSPNHAAVDFNFCFNISSFFILFIYFFVLCSGVNNKSDVLIPVRQGFNFDDV